MGGKSMISYAHMTESEKNAYMQTSMKEQELKVQKFKQKKVEKDEYGNPIRFNTIGVFSANLPSFDFRRAFGRSM